MTDEREPLAVLLLGPTGSGKTALSLSLAERFNGEIVSCDSVAVYRGMDLGTAKPTPEERARIPHHLIDVADPDQPFTAGDYSRQARAALREIAERAINSPSSPAEPASTCAHSLKASSPALHARKTCVNASAAAPSATAATGSIACSAVSIPHRRAHPRQRHAQAYPRHRSLPRRAPAHVERARARSPHRLSPAAHRPQPASRQRLYERLNQRCAEMFASGLIEETRALLACYGPIKALDSLGYRQAQSVLLKGVSEKVAIAEAQQGHRNYAKRQLTWFRREPGVHWIEAFGDEPQALAATCDLVRDNLGS